MQTIEDDLELQLAHAADHHLAGRRTCLRVQGGILGHQRRQTSAQLALIGLGLRRDRQHEHWNVCHKKNVLCS